MKVYVVLRNQYIGTLSEDENGTLFGFTYADNIIPGNYILGLPSKENTDKHLFSIFDDLIPENKQKLDAVKAKHNIKGTIEILLYLDNIHGSFEFYRNESDIQVKDGLSVIQYKDVKADILGSYTYPEILDNYSLDEIPESGYSNPGDTTLGLSGYQEKYAVFKNNDTRIIKYAGKEQTEYFIKPFNIEFSHHKKGNAKFSQYRKRYYPYLLVNEHIFMSLAKEFGFDIPYNGLIKDNVYNEYHLVIKRFDRYETDYRFDHHTVNGLLGKTAIDKYKVTFTDIIKMIKDKISPDDMVTLFKFMLFSVIISHGDLHAKNISLIYCSNGLGDKSMTLAPMYDILTTNIYAASQNKQDIGMRLHNKHANIRDTDLLYISDLMGIDKDESQSIIKDFSNKFLNLFEKHIDMLPDKIKTLPIKKGDYRNDTITLHKEYLSYFHRRKIYIEKYLIEKQSEKNIFL